jgi:predicted ATP-dependent serine protease
MTLTGFERGIDLYNKKKYIKSGLGVLDDILGGGLEPGLLYVLYGGMSVNNLLYPIITTKLNNLKIPILIIDCDNWFNPYRLNQDLTSNDHLKKILVARAFNWNHFSRIITEKLTNILDEPSIILVTGLNTLFPSNTKSESDYSDFVRIISKLKNIAAPDNIILVTYHDKTLLNFVAHYSQVIVFVHKNRTGLSLVLEKHPALSIRTANLTKKTYQSRKNLRLEYFMR